MSRKVNTDFSTSSWDFLGKEMSKFIEEIEQETKDNLEQGLTKAGEHLKSKLEDSTPVDTGELKNSWEMTTKYKGVRYINNTNLTKYKEQDVPLLNIVEFSTSHGKPFVRKTFDANKDKIQNIILENIKKEN